MSRESRIRILVALDGTQPSEAPLRQLASLLMAEALEVIGLYVEDEDLLRAASLPGLREITFSGEQAVLDAERLAREIAGEAALARAAFELVASRLTSTGATLQYRFLVARGRHAEELARAAEASDFVLISRALRTAGLRPRFGSSFAELLRQPKNVLVVNEPWDSGSSVVVLRSSDEALRYAERMAESEDLRLVVATPPGAAAPDLPEGAVRRSLPDWQEETIAELCLREDARLLVVPAATDVNWAELLVSLMDKLPCSLLKVA